MNGLVTMTPSSVDAVGGTATINANGGVDFENISELDLNGVFTSDFDNYVIFLSGGVSANAFIRAKMLDENGDPNSSGYVDQYINYTSSLGSGRSVVKTTGWDFTNWTDAINATEMHLYGPFLPTPTVQRSVNVDRDRGARMYENASTHSVAASWRGIRFATNANTMTGNVVVMGYAE